MNKKQVIVASKNPTKIQSAQKGFEALFPTDTFDFQGIAVPSGVADQPMGDEETFKGAWNRVQAAKQKVPSAAFWIGIEGGNIRHEDGNMEVMAWIVVLSEHQMGKARTAGFFLPPKVIQLVDEGLELGHAMDAVFATQNSKHSGGASMTDLCVTNYLSESLF